MMKSWKRDETRMLRLKLRGERLKCVEKAGQRCRDYKRMVGEIHNVLEPAARIKNDILGIFLPFIGVILPIQPV